jgi:cell division protein FtsQ
MQYNQPNTRERIAARRNARRGRKGANRPMGSVVRPNAGRAVLGWLASGRLISLGLFLASMGALVYLFTATSYTIGRIEVEGNNALSSEHIISLAALQGAPIWFVDAESAVERLKTNAYIEQATVSVELPDLARITLTERRPDVRWLVGGIQYLVDSSGKVLAAADDPPDAEVLVITASGTTLTPGDMVDLDALQLARTLAFRLPSEVRLSPQTIGWDYGLGVYVKTATNQTIVFGRSEDIDRKLLILDHLLNKEPTSFTYMDLRAANPYYQNVGQIIPLPNTIEQGATP